MERAVWRIIDANFNRAREATRVVEEYCRFALDSKALAGRTKQLRHELSRAIGGLETGRLIAARDTLGDVGVDQYVDNQLDRADLRDSFTAGCKRLTEALRAIAETSRLENRTVAEAVEKLRYDAYTLEKDIVLFADPIEKYKSVRLYIVITSVLPVEVISLTHKCVLGGADCIQLRAKDIEDDKLLALAEAFVGICKDGGVLSVINDRVDIAVASGADGLHLGQNDLPIEKARKLQATPLVVGKSTHSIRQLRSACDERATYAALGPVFATGTKPDVRPVGLGYVRQAAEILADEGIGNVAIGGITADNVEQVLNAGAAGIAVCAAVTKAEDPTAMCRLLKEKIDAFKARQSPS
ncbi:MAG: thiamine phosphate synthase [Phycisphaerales bacterium]|nr:MAG: thiamine phosphate synthase [Phycisphaerales bacterium]